MDTLLVELDRAVANPTRMLSGTRVWLDVTSHEQQPVAVGYSTRTETKDAGASFFSSNRRKLSGSLHLAEAAPVRTTAD